MSWVTVKFRPALHSRFQRLRRTGGFGSIQKFVDHLLSLEQKRQDDLVASVDLPVTSTPLRSSRSRPVTPSFSPVVGPSAVLSPLVEVVGDSPIALFPHPSVPVAAPARKFVKFAVD